MILFIYPNFCSVTSNYKPDTEHMNTVFRQVQCLYTFPPYQVGSIAVFCYFLQQHDLTFKISPNKTMSRYQHQWQEHEQHVKNRNNLTDIHIITGGQKVHKSHMSSIQTRENKGKVVYHYNRTPPLKAITRNFSSQSYEHIMALMNQQQTNKRYKLVREWNNRTESPNMSQSGKSKT